MSSSSEEAEAARIRAILTVPMPSGTVRELIGALQQMPPDLLVTRGCDEVVAYAELRSNGPGSMRHVALS